VLLTKQVLGRDLDVVERELRGVGDAQAERATATFVSIEQIRRVTSALAMRPVRARPQ